jgi:hypothetical protein
MSLKSRGITSGALGPRVRLRPPEMREGPRGPRKNILKLIKDSKSSSKQEGYSKTVWTPIPNGEQTRPIPDRPQAAGCGGTAFLGLL